MVSKEIQSEKIRLETKKLFLNHCFYRPCCGGEGKSAILNDVSVSKPKFPEKNVYVSLYLRLMVVKPFLQCHTNQIV